MPLTKNDKCFLIEHQYQLYLSRVKLNEKDMHPQQKIQTRQAFFGACGQMLMLMRDQIAELPEDDGVEVLERMTNEIGTYFVNRVAKSN